jgi:hypothetical protein
MPDFGIPDHDFQTLSGFQLHQGLVELEET